MVSPRVADRLCQGYKKATDCGIGWVTEASTTKAARVVDKDQVWCSQVLHLAAKPLEKGLPSCDQMVNKEGAIAEEARPRGCVGGAKHIRGKEVSRKVLEKLRWIP